MFRFSTIIFATLAGLVLVSCQKISSRQDLEKIQALEKQANESRESASLGGGTLNEDLLKDLGTAYLLWADNYPDAPETPEFLFRAGELYSNELQDFPKAIEVFERDYKNYPDHETAANALFFIGYLYNNSLHDIAKAELYYKEFIAKYPQHNLAKHAEFELGSLGMSPDELFAKITQQDSSLLPIDTAAAQADR